MWKWALNGVNEFTPLLCLCLRPSRLKNCPLIKALPLSSFRVADTHATHETNRWKVMLTASLGSHGICGMLLYFPPNSPMFGFFCWVSANVCMCCWLFSTTRSQSQVIECMNQADLSHWSADWDRKTWKTTSCFSSMYVTLFRREFIRKYST